MVSDSIANVAIPAAPIRSGRDSGKKKRARSAKLKQSKRDVRREQWLSSGAVKNKEGKEEMHSGVVVQGRRERSSPCVKEEVGSREGENNLENNIGSIHPGEEPHHHHHESEWESNSPSSFTSSVHDSETFTGSSGSSSSSRGCCSGDVTEEEDEDDGCLDDWEAVADALAADEKPKSEPLEPPREDEVVVKKGPPCQIENVKPHCGRAKAWRPDDVLRPHSLPNLAKQLSLPSSGGKRFGGGAPWTRHSVVSDPSTCPLCTEDLDLTDTSFLPCLCGFKLCLFCHKKILEGDARCPNCRKPYENVVVKVEASVDGGSLTFRLPRSCSMATRF